MGGLLIGQLASRGGVSRKAIRHYESLGILPAPGRTPAGYRLYRADAVALVRFVGQARALGLSLAEIRTILDVRRSGRPPCAHVRTALRRKLDDLDAAIEDLKTLRTRLRRALNAPVPASPLGAALCPHIESAASAAKGGDDDGQWNILALPGMHRVPGSRDRGRPGADRRER
jgi:DNA-binding transcriptional MerR regulator